MNNQQNVVVIYAANGNPTGIMYVPDASRRSEYAVIAKEYIGKNPRVEQFGFVEEDTLCFQMSGSEFCGNAARAAALLISQKTGQMSGSFTMSGFSGRVDYQVFPDNIIECTFNDFKVEIKETTAMGTKAMLVDMGGIVHVVLPTSISFENKPEYYESAHKQIVSELDLGERLAVGVIWRKVIGNRTKIDPVVWVKGINSFFYETACGSGTLAVLLVGDTSAQEVLQPSGGIIYAERDGNNLILRSEMSRSVA